MAIPRYLTAMYRHLKARHNPRILENIFVVAHYERKRQGKSFIFL